MELIKSYIIRIVQPCFKSIYVLFFKINYAHTDEVKIKFYKTFI